MSILNNLNRIYFEIKKTYQVRYQECLKILKAFLIILGARLIVIGLNNLFVNNQVSLQYIIFYLATSLLMIGLEVGMIKLLFTVKVMMIIISYCLKKSLLIKSIHY